MPRDLLLLRLLLDVLLGTAGHHPVVTIIIVVVALPLVALSVVVVALRMVTPMALRWSHEGRLWYYLIKKIPSENATGEVRAVDARDNPADELPPADRPPRDRGGPNPPPPDPP